MTMPTLRRRALVSLAAAMTAALTLGACYQAASVRDGPLSMDEALLRFRFDNGGREHVHVYLIGEKREWLLGRVEAGAIATLRIPEQSLVENASFVRLVVIEGEGITLQAARNPRARVTLAQPASAILSQQWMFSQGSLTSLRR
jgi:hypothetical protein